MTELKETLDKIWSALVKARAGYRSEISGKTERLHSHHLKGKSNYRLRYDLENGVCITAGEHFYGFHNTGRRENYERLIFNKRRKGLSEYLDCLKHQTGKTRLQDVQVYLESELRKYGVEA